MTTINAMRFDFHRGIMICDEQTSMGDGFLSNVSDKIRPVVPSIITKNHGITVAIGNTGSVATGTILKESFYKRLNKLYKAKTNELGKTPENFMDLEEMAKLVFDLILELNEDKLDEKLISEFGFNRKEFLQGKYVREGKSYEIKDDDVVKKITSWMSNENEAPQMSSIFQNAALMAGYDDKHGFCMYQYDQRFGYWHKVQTSYIAEGSGRHSVDPELYDFIENLYVDERRNNIDPVKGACAMISAVNSCELHEAGIGGYFNILVFDGTKKNSDRLVEINDSRAKLASNIMKCSKLGYIEIEKVYSLIDALIFKNEVFLTVYNDFMKSLNNKEAADKLLRGYKIHN